MGSEPSPGPRGWPQTTKEKGACSDFFAGTLSLKSQTATPGLSRNARAKQTKNERIHVILSGCAPIKVEKALTFGLRIIASPK
jgi:hypothetical protein